MVVRLRPVCQTARGAQLWGVSRCGDADHRGARPGAALVTKNALLHGRRMALGTALGVCAGLSVWTAATALGLASLVSASQLAFTALRLLGAAYLIWLGVQALMSARRRASERGGSRPAERSRAGGPFVLFAVAERSIASALAGMLNAAAPLFTALSWPPSGHAAPPRPTRWWAC